MVKEVSLIRPTSTVLVQGAVSEYTYIFTVGSKANCLEK